MANCRYAVKDINKFELLSHKTGYDMLYSELKSLKVVSDHAFITKLNFAFHTTESCFMVLDLKSGADLRYYLKKKLIFEECNVAFYVACISTALNHCHLRGILHRDVKPENIILDDQGFPHLADFGVSYVQEPSTGNSIDGGEAVVSMLASGTKQYLAPEVFTSGHVHGPESDFWSLGVVAYELLHGSRPFSKAPKEMIEYLNDARKRHKNNEHRQKVERKLAKTSTIKPEGSPSASEKHDNANSPAESGAQNFDGFTTAASSHTSNVSPQASPEHSRFSTPAATPMGSPSSTLLAAAVAVTNGGSGGGSAITSKSSMQSSQSPSRAPGPGLFPKIGCSPRESETVDGGAEDVFARESRPDKQVQQRPTMSTKSGIHDITSQETSGSSAVTGAISNTTTKTALDSPCVYGTWWQYTKEPTGHKLILDIPRSNPWLGHISSHCQEVLQGLFELRPTHRLGGRNIEKLSSHPWLAERNLSNWATLTNKDPNVTPHFIPGKNWMTERLKHKSNANEEFKPIVSSDKQVKFTDFHYTAPDLCQLLTPVQIGAKTEALDSPVPTRNAANEQPISPAPQPSSRKDNKLPDMKAAEGPSLAQAYANYNDASGKINPGRLLQERAKAKMAASSDIRASYLLDPHPHGHARKNVPVGPNNSIKRESSSLWMSSPSRDSMGSASATYRKDLNGASVSKRGGYFPKNSASRLNFN